MNNREIKFRAWDEKEGVMLVSQDLTRNRKYWTWLGAKDVPLMQYTGLKDKNGKEIYEGDIVKSGEVLAYIEYSPKSAGYKLRSIEDGCFSRGFNSDLEDSEVIGNVFKNPELLNE